MNIIRDINFQNSAIDYDINFNEDLTIKVNLLFRSWGTS